MLEHVYVRDGGGGKPTGQRVLVVEDDPAVARSLVRAFCSAGWHADVATGVREAIARIAGHAVAIIDLELPDGLGLDLLRTIRERGASMRVAICTGRLDGAACVAASAIQPDAFFAKPFDFDRLLEWVEHGVPPPPVPDGTKVQ